MLVKSCYRLAILTLLSSLSQSAGAAEQYTADFVLPQLGQRGTTVTIRIEGSRLQTAEEVLFYREGIRCTAIRQLDTVPHPHNGTPLKAEPGKAIELDFEIAADAPLGEYYLRLRTKQKLSELLSFWVTPFPVVPEEHAFVDTGETRNDSPEYAQRIPFNCTVSGFGSSNERANDWDVYSVVLKENQRCTCQIISARLGTIHYGGLTDMVIEVRSPSGKRVARNSRSSLFAHDPVVSFIAPEAGDYLIIVGQQMDSEIRNIHYGLHVGDFPRPTITFPLGGQLGDEMDLDMFYLDGSREKLKATLPTEVAAFEKSMVELTTITDLPEIPSPNRFQVAAFPNVYEVEGHSKPENAQTIDQHLPVALNGIIKTEGEKDWYQFSAKKGERYRVRVYAQTLGSKLDPFVWIRPAEGNPSRKVYEQDDSLWDGHDWEGHHYRHQVKDRLDPIFMFEPDADGDYLLGIADTRRESGEDYVYRVELQPHHDSLFLYCKDYPSLSSVVRDVIGVHRGATQTRPFAIMNGFGSQYDGPIRLEVRGLPPGVEFESLIFTRNDPVIMTTFRVSADVKPQTALLEIIPHAVDENVSLTGTVAQTHASNAQRGDYSPVFNKTRKLGFAILEEAPFDISIDEPGIGLAKNAELDLKVNVRRKGDFTGAIYLEMDWLPQGVTKQPPLIIPEGEDVGYYKISATSQAATGKYRLTITARENEGGDPRSGVGFHYIGSPFISVEVTEPYLQIELQRAAVEQGKRGELVGKIHHLRKFSGVATARLLRLPNGVSLIEEPAIKYGQESVVFPLKIEADALTGQYKEIACDVKITDEGQDIHQQSGSGVIRVDALRGER